MEVQEAQDVRHLSLALRRPRFGYHNRVTVWRFVWPFDINSVDNGGLLNPKTHLPACETLENYTRMCPDIEIRDSIRISTPICGGRKTRMTRSCTIAIRIFRRDEVADSKSRKWRFSCDHYAIVRRKPAHIEL